MMRQLTDSEQAAYLEAWIKYHEREPRAGNTIGEHWAFEAGYIARQDQVAALTTERDALRAALKPFADNAEVWEENESHFTVVYCRRGVKDKPDLKITVGDLLAARYILSKVEGRELGEGS